MNFTEIHNIRRVKGMLERINHTVKSYSKTELVGVNDIFKDLSSAETRLTFEAIRAASPEEILRNASRLANLFRSR